MDLARTFTGAIHRVDHTIGRLAGRRRVLFEVRTPVYAAVLGPVYAAAARLRGVAISFTSEDPDRISHLLPGRVLTHDEAEWTRFDLYVNADPWAAARLRRCAARLNLFHGVAGKYDLDRPVDLPMGFEYYDRVAFINRDRMQRYLDAGIVSSTQARLVGYPKLDALATGRVDGAAVRTALGLDTARPTALYAPTYSPASSLHVAGEAIVMALADAGLNVLVKLHDRSLDPDPRYTDGIDWRSRMRRLQQPGQICYVESGDASPYLAAADLMVTDHSSVGFEYLVLDRPLVIVDAPDLAACARINPEKVALLRSAADVATTPAALAEVSRAALASPDRLSNARRRIAAEMFHDPGNATGRAVALVQELLESPALAHSAARSPAPQPLGGGA